MSVNITIQKKLGNFRLDVHLESYAGRIGILGASGCGKSMTLKSIAGIEKPDSGQIILDGRTVFDSNRKINCKPQQRNVGYLFQNYALFPTMTVRANISAGLKGTRRENAARTAQMIRRFHLEGLENRLPGELSGGQQQRTALARIMAYEPDVILLDEPYAALDQFLRDRLQQEMMELLSGYNGTVILVSHNRDEIYQFSEELMIMEEGRMICSGKPKDLFENPQYTEAARLTGCKNIVPVRRISPHTLEIPSWNAQITLARQIPDEVRFIGIRAHDFMPVWEAPAKNCIRVSVQSMSELLFERKYFLRAADPQAEEICWFVQRPMCELLDRNGLPDYLKIPEDKVLLLR